jgi:hypothetical protein
LGHARSAQGRPHRLPLASSPLRRPNAVVLFVAPSEVRRGRRFGATPFDIEGEGVSGATAASWCTFDVMVEEFGLGGLDPSNTWRLSCAVPTPPGPTWCRKRPVLLAASLGLSRMYADDLAQLEAGLGLYDAFYRWCRDATDETHNWPARPAGPSRTARRDGRERRHERGAPPRLPRRPCGRPDPGRRAEHGISFGEAFRVWLRWLCCPSAGRPVRSR